MKEPKPMWNDPAEDPMVREVLDAGRSWSVSDYDHEQGLAQHLQHVAAGTPAPEWARELLQQGSGGAGGGVAAGGAAAGLATAAWIAVPILMAGAVTAALVWRDAPTPVAPEVHGTEGTRPAMVETAPSAAPGQARFAAPAIGPVQPLEGGPAVGADDIGEQVEAAVRRAASADDGHAAPRAKRGGTSSGAKRLPAKPAPELGPNTDALMQAPVAKSVKVADPELAAASAVAHADAERSTAEGPAPAEDLNTKWARGVYADADQAQDASEDRLEREMRMLKVAQAALRNNPQRALQLARQGEREYGASMFEAERQHVLILALVQLGRMDEARRVAKPYLAKYPRGPFSARVRSALAAGRVDP